MTTTIDRHLIEKCFLLQGMIESNTLPRPGAGICANLGVVVDFSKYYIGSRERLLDFFRETGRDTIYPVEHAMHPEYDDDQAEQLYMHHAITDALWTGPQREHRIALLNEFIAWLGEQ